MNKQAQFQNEKIILSNLTKITDNEVQQINQENILYNQTDKPEEQIKFDNSPGIRLNFYYKSEDKPGQHVQARMNQMKEMYNVQKPDNQIDKGDEKKIIGLQSSEQLSPNRKQESPYQQLSPNRKQVSPNRYGGDSSPNKFRYEASGSEIFMDDFQIQKKIQVLENNAKFFESQANPLFRENQQLKDQMIQLNEVIKG